MAVSRSPKEFSLRMTVVAESAASGVERVVRAAALLGDQSAVLATPVDTGRARNNWLVSVGKPRDDVPNPNVRTGADAIAQGRQGVKGFRAGKGAAGAIFIANNVEYIVPLEDGHSAQRPEGMMKHAMKAIRDKIRRSSILPRS